MPFFKNDCSSFERSMSEPEGFTGANFHVNLSKCVLVVKIILVSEYAKNLGSCVIPTDKMVKMMTKNTSMIYLAKKKKFKYFQLYINLTTENYTRLSDFP